MNNVCITGGCGFVGRAFVRRFLELGARVTVIDDCSSGAPDPAWPKAPQLIFIRTDCRNYFKYATTCDFDLIVHLAAVVGGRLKIEGDPLAVATDLAIDSDFFNYLARLPEKQRPQAIYFSSSAVYPVELQGRNYNVNLSESLVNFTSTRVAHPDFTYGWSKLTGEYLAQFAAHQYGIDVKIYRPFSGYGPGQSFDYPFPSIVRRVLNNENPVVVWGSGDQLRDFIYIDDVVDAVLATKDGMRPGEVLNLGSGEGTSFRELALLTARVLGRDIEVVNDASKPEGVFARVADTYKFNRFYPRPLLPLQQGIDRKSVV